MGEVIRRTAAAEDIFADVKTTLTRAQARGGQWQALAEAGLVAVVALDDATAKKLADARAVAAPLAAAVAARDDEADALLGKVADDVFNDVGRPGTDAALSVLFPGGVSYYAEGDTEGQADRMALLAELLVSGVHPRLEAAKAQAYATLVSQKGAELAAAVEAARAPMAKVTLLERARQATARAGHAELLALKRRYRAEPFTEAEIHEVIPDRPRGAKKSGEPPPVPPVPPAPPAGPTG